MTNFEAVPMRGWLPSCVRSAFFWSGLLGCLTELGNKFRKEKKRLKTSKNSPRCNKQQQQQQAAATQNLCSNRRALDLRTTITLDSSRINRTGCKIQIREQK